VLEIGLETNEKIFLAVLCPFRSPPSSAIPIPETTADYALWKIDSGAALDSTTEGL
jgi:hypothetical protein